jgi:hypothetical protein
MKQIIKGSILPKRDQDDVLNEISRIPAEFARVRREQAAAYGDPRKEANEEEDDASE